MTRDQVRNLVEGMALLVLLGIVVVGELVWVHDSAARSLR